MVLKGVIVHILFFLSLLCIGLYLSNLFLLVPFHHILVVYFLLIFFDDMMLWYIFH